MERNIVNLDRETIEKILAELNEVESLTPEDAIKFRINNIINILSKAANLKDEESIEDMVYRKMKEAVSKNPDLHVKLYMLYRNLTEGKVSQEEAREMYENYVQMYPYDTMIY